MATGETQAQHPRREQMFPVLGTGDIERLKRFGEPQRYKAGACVFGAGENAPGLIVVLGDNIEITQNDGIGGRSTIITHGPNQFVGELAQLSDRPSLVNANAIEPVEALIIAPQRLRDLLVQEAELQALKFQINPHFLFNSLNSLNALILTRPDDASKMITRLADFLRSTLNAGESGERSLREELAAVHLYLDIEKVRFAEKLQVTEKIEEAALTVRVPAMILQPLFENAIKHGLQNSLAPVVITLSAGLEGEFLNIRLENTLEKRDKIVTPGSGVGLRNIEGRLRRLFPRHGQLVRITAAADLFRVELFIPAGGGAP